MALTRDFKDTVVVRLQSDAAFARALFEEALTLFVNGEPGPAKRILRDLVIATVGFVVPADEIHMPAERLNQMLSRSGNSSMSNISAAFAEIKRGLSVDVRMPFVKAQVRGEQFSRQSQLKKQNTANHANAIPREDA